MKNKEQENFFRNYRGKYSQYWIERWGLIPELPTSFDNANSIYELLAWLQRAFKNLLDDFQTLESEMDDFKNAIIDFLQHFLPELLRNYLNSEEFNNLLDEKLKDYFEKIIKPYIDGLIAELDKRIDALETCVEDLKKRVKALEDKVKEIEAKLREHDNAIQELTNNYNNLKRELDREKTERQKLENALGKIIQNLRNSGAWSGDLDGNFNNGRNIATGNINVFGGTPDGSSFIRTNNGRTENDLAGGI